MARNVKQKNKNRVLPARPGPLNSHSQVPILSVSTWRALLRAPFDLITTNQQAHETLSTVATISAAML